MTFFFFAIIAGVIGGGLGIATIRAQTANCRRRTQLDFTSGKEIWSDVERWAKEQGYTLKNQNGAERTYQKGAGFWAASSCLSLRQDGDKVHVEAWSLANMLVFKAEIATDEAILAAKPIRKKNAERVNKLLAILGSPVTITVG
ncbi:MAG: hypothetical protein FWF41_05145 [Betaproteobacteria bacterium]|nr:hypothetical protein [Betaproteobacteria bacterium]